MTHSAPVISPLAWLKTPSPTRTTAAVLTLYVAAAALLYGRVVPAWFLADEIIVLSRIADLGPLQVANAGGLFGNFVPVLFVSLWIDWKLFGLAPAGYHVHSIISCVVAATLVFWVMRRFCSVRVSLLAGACFLVAPPTVAVTSWICTRHYVEGMIPCLVAVLLTLSYLRTPTTARAATIAVLYLVACASKEIFTALPAALLFVPAPRLAGSDPQAGAADMVSNAISAPVIAARVKLLAAMGIAAAIYLVWRASVVEAVFSKRGFTQPIGDMAAYFLSAWPHFTGWMLHTMRKGSEPWLGFLVVNSLIVLVILLLLARRKGAGAATAIVLFLAASLPSALVLNSPRVAFLDIANHYCLRFVYLPFVVVLMFGIWAVNNALPRGLAAVVLTLLLTVTAVYGWQQVRPWVRDGRMTRGATEVYRQWWDRRAVVASDIPRSLHLGLQRLWIREHGQPEVLAKVISTKIKSPSQSLSIDDPYIDADDVVFVEDLQWRGSTRTLDRATFLDTYAIE